MADASSNKKPIRILQVVGGMNRGGTETWLMNVLRNIDRSSYHMDFLVHTMSPCDYDDEIRSLGSSVIPCLSPSNPWLYSQNFKKVIKENGPYDVVHSHVHHFSGFILRLAYQAGVATRIAHSHLDTSMLQPGSVRRLYLQLMKRWLAKYATVGLSASQEAQSALFGQEQKLDSRYRVLYCSIDFAPFRIAVNPVAIRSKLGLPVDAFIMGHVGRFAEQKNHDFLVDVAIEVINREQNAYLLLAGDGPLRPEIEHKVAQEGFVNRVVFAGSRSDVPELMLGAMDIFIFPSYYEGLGLALIEAQAAGLPCIISDCIPEEADIVESLITRLPLSQTVCAWADEVLSMKTRRLPLTQSETLKVAEESAFNISLGLKELERIYDG